MTCGAGPAGGRRSRSVGVPRPRAWRRSRRAADAPVPRTFGMRARASLRVGSDRLSASRSTCALDEAGSRSSTEALLASEMDAFDAGDDDVPGERSADGRSRASAPPARPTSNNDDNNARRATIRHARELCSGVRSLRKPASPRHRRTDGRRRREGRCGWGPGRVLSGDEQRRERTLVIVPCGTGSLEVQTHRLSSHTAL